MVSYLPFGNLPTVSKAAPVKHFTEPLTYLLCSAMMQQTLRRLRLPAINSKENANASEVEMPLDLLDVGQWPATIIDLMCSRHVNFRQLHTVCVEGNQALMTREGRASKLFR